VPTSVLGTVLALVFLGVTIGAIYVVSRRPFVGLGVLVAGMAFHNILLMLLLSLHTPGLLIRAAQAWKELVLAALVAIAVVQLVRTHRRGENWQWIPTDWIAIAFTGVLLVYLAIPSSLLGGDTNLLQKLVAFRVDALIPLLYFLGRVFARPVERDLDATTWLIVGAAAVVGAFGVYELFFVPTARWLDWGVNLYSSWLGFKYKGPAGLPENFFQSLPDGLLLRRMVSTYISPLGIAYTGLLVFPLAAMLIDRARRRVTLVAALVAGALFLIGVLLAVTRLAELCLAAEAVLLALLWRSRLSIALVPVIGAGVAAVLFWYPSVGPVVDPYLLPGESHRHTILYMGDPSFAEHLRFLESDLALDIKHPFGAGLGGSVHRFVQTTVDTAGTGESAVLGVFGDVGLLGGLLYVALYGIGLFYGLLAAWRAPERSYAYAIALVAGAGGIALIPITLTSDVWGDLSVTFLFWWAVGYSASVAAREHHGGSLLDLLPGRTAPLPDAAPMKEHSRR
jgi:hypothetical protein